MKFKISGILLILGSYLFAQSPVVENVRFVQRTDGSLIVDIYYDVSYANYEKVKVSIEASDDHGATWDLPCSRLDGDVDFVTTGQNKHFQWHFYDDNPDTSGYGYRVRVTAEALCQMYITKDTTLVEDLVCDPNTGTAVIIGAPNVTLDLGGHVIYGFLNGGVYAENVEGITIRNGTFEGFLGAITLSNTDSATIENLTVRNLDISDPDNFIVGIGVGWSKGVVIRNTKLQFLPVVHKEAIVTNHSDITVSNIEVQGGSVGINFGGPPGGDPELNRVNGTVMNNKFIDVTIAGVLIQRTTSALITGNEFIRNDVGVSAYIHGYYPSGVTGVNVDGNTFRDCHNGIHFWGIRESSITNNMVKNSGGGIQLRPHMFNDPINSPDSCFYATENVVADNIALGNLLDLYHHEKAVGNTWIDNLFWTKEGDEIPDCNTNIRKTAQGALLSADSTAAELAADVQLLVVNSGRCDTTGNSYQWEYVYQSIGQQQYYRCRYKDGQIMSQDTVGGDAYDFHILQPIPATWIDSDSAIVITDGMGGKEFRKTFELQTIDMFLSKTYTFSWEVRYFAQDTMLQIGCDATMEQ